MVMLLYFMIIIVTQWAVAQEGTNKVLEYKGARDYFHML